MHKLQLIPLLSASISLICQAAPSDDLLGYWTLDNTSSDSATGGSHSDNGSWVGNSNYSSTTAVFGAAAAFNGSSHIEIPTSSDLAHTGGDLSLSVWCQVTNFDTRWQSVLSKGENNNYRIARLANDATQIAYAGGSGDISGGAVNDGAWHHIMAISEDGEATFLYVDGNLVATGPAPTLTDSGNPLLIGENPESTGRQWNGHIDDVALFDRALSAQQANAVYIFGTTYGYPMSDVIQILDAHDAGNSVVIGNETWTYSPSNTGTDTFIPLRGDGSGVDFSQGPLISNFASSPVFIESGNNATLTWQIDSDFTSVSIDQGIGSVLDLTNASGAGSISVSPTTSTSYTITSTNSDGSTSLSTTLFVDVDPSTPRINEFVASNNSNGLLDEDGDDEDWIEIYNPGPNAADLSSFYLTDDDEELDQWAFPAITMEPDSYLIVFASSKARSVAGSELHTNFKLSAGGEYLALTRDDGAGGFEIVREFAPEYPDQDQGISYGISTDNITVGYLAELTPNAENVQASLGFVADTKFDIDRGFQTTPFDLTITSETLAAEIRYTTDGSSPTSTTGIVYTGPIRISETTTIRAAAFLDGFFETDVDTHTYLFLDDVRDQFANGDAPAGWPTGNVNGQQFNYGMDPDITNRYSDQEMIDALSAIPSFSLSLSQDDFTGGGNQGIYVNPGQRGRSWERPASMEIIHPDGAMTNVQSNCGIRIRGGFSRSTANPKHAFRLFFRGEYGNGKLEYPLFGAEGADEFDKVDLRTSQNYSWAFQGDDTNTFLREVLGRDLQGSFGHIYTRSRYYHLYINGIYWGLYMTQERAEANHGEAYLGGDADSYDTLKSAGASGDYDTEATDGDFNEPSDWNTLWDMTNEQETSPEVARFMAMQGLRPNGIRDTSLPVYLDVDNMIDYHLIIGYTGNYDAALSNFVGASNNWYALRDRNRGNFGFQFFVHDGEHTLGAGGGRWNNANDRMNTSNGSGDRDNYIKSNPTFLHFDLADSTEEYRLRFADRTHSALFNGGLLTTNSVMDHMNARRETVSDVIIAESARWGDSKSTDPLDREDWNDAVTVLANTISTRRDVFLGHIREANLYPDLDAPIYSQHGGIIATGTSISAIAPLDGTQLYYMIGTGDSDLSDWQDDLDPRLIGGSINPSAQMINITGGGNGVPLTTYISEGDNWKYLDDGSNQGTAWRAQNFNDNAWANGDSELGYGDGDEETIVNSGPENQNFATTYFRKNVTISNPSAFGDFEIRITYDDAYVIYVNGTEVARHAGLPSNPAFDSFATNNVTNNAIDTLTIPTSAFSAGENTIAVEIHQNSQTSSDISFNLRLREQPLGGGETATLTLPEQITEPVWIKSRTFNSTTGTWSALNQAFFTTASPADAISIVISEVNYHPTEPTAAELNLNPNWDEDDFEYIEIMNIGANTVDLGEVALVLIPVNDHLEGVEFSFPLGTLIAPNERLTIAANPQAFAARYPSATISGDYSGRLSNSGEWITLADAAGEVIDSFRYNDAAPWPTSADGDGYTIVRNNPENDLDPSLSTSWTTGLFAGSPGAPDGSVFTGDPLADLDGDGYPAIIEYAQGLSDTESNSQLHINTTTIEVDGILYPSVSYREDPNAIDATLNLQHAESLQPNDWTDSKTELVHIETSVDSDGILRHSYRLIRPIQDEIHHFFRLRVEY